MHTMVGDNVTPTRAVCTKITETEIICEILAIFCEREIASRQHGTLIDCIDDGPLELKVTDY